MYVSIIFHSFITFLRFVQSQTPEVKNGVPLETKLVVINLSSTLALNSENRHCFNVGAPEDL